MRFDMDFSAEENGLLLMAVEWLKGFHDSTVEAHSFRDYRLAGIDVGQTLDILRNKAAFMVDIQNGQTLETAINKLSKVERAKIEGYLHTPSVYSH
jgi:hypothetical protein